MTTPNCFFETFVLASGTKVLFGERTKFEIESEFQLYLSHDPFEIFIIFRNGNSI